MLKMKKVVVVAALLVLIPLVVLWGATGSLDRYIDVNSGRLKTVRYVFCFVCVRDEVEDTSFSELAASHSLIKGPAEWRLATKTNYGLYALRYNTDTRYAEALSLCKMLLYHFEMAETTPEMQRTHILKFLQWLQSGDIDEMRTWYDEAKETTGAYQQTAYGQAEWRVFLTVPSHGEEYDEALACGVCVYLPVRVF